MTIIKSKKKMISIMVVVLLIFSQGILALADTGNFYFSMVKGEGPYISGSVRKADDEQLAYVTPTDGHLDPGDVFGFRVRTSGGVMATEYKTWTSFTRGTLKYTLLTGKPDNYYKLYGQIDSTSEFNYQDVEGRWTP